MAFNYPRDEDRFNPSPIASEAKAANPIPSWPEIDVMLTHGPPHTILDKAGNKERGMTEVGCEHLFRAVARCRPRLHCFGHIHESWGAEVRSWAGVSREGPELDEQQILTDRSAYLDLTEGNLNLKFGEDTVFINAAIMDVHCNPRNAPWLIDLDLPLSRTSQENGIPA